MTVALCVPGYMRDDSLSAEQKSFLDNGFSQSCDKCTVCSGRYLFWQVSILAVLRPIPQTTLLMGHSPWDKRRSACENSVHCKTCLSGLVYWMDRLVWFHYF